MKVLYIELSLFVKASQIELVIRGIEDLGQFPLELISHILCNVCAHCIVESKHLLIPCIRRIYTINL